MDHFHVYKDIEARTGGEIYVGVVGPVRTGKSTFIKRFMELLVLPNLPDGQKKAQTRDELPQSACLLYTSRISIRKDPSTSGKRITRVPSNPFQNVLNWIRITAKPISSFPKPILGMKSTMKL